MSRRSFLDICIGALIAFFGAICAATGLKFIWPSKALTGESETRFVQIPLLEVPVGKSKIQPFEGKKVLVIRTAETEVAALSAVCTHLGCIVKWHEVAKRVECPCHAAIFDLNGNVVSGPAPKPLDRMPIVIKGDQIVLGEAK